MFSHEIYNPNNFAIQNKDFYTIPFGLRCTSAIACTYANLRKFSLPFDWVIPLFPSKIHKVLQNDFEDFIPDVNNEVFENKYNIRLVHFNVDRNKGIQDYERRIQRFMTILNEPTKLYFVYINEDYLYDPIYRDEEFNEQNFIDMLTLEEYLQERYVNINYNILYFNFKNHDIPKSSKIINIVLHSNQFYDKLDGASHDSVLRDYCGKVMSELFESNMDEVSRVEDFNF